MPALDLLFMQVEYDEKWVQSKKDGFKFDYVVSIGLSTSVSCRLVTPFFPYCDFRLKIERG